MEARVDEEPDHPLHEDVLGLILSHVPLIDLYSASHVSTTWNHALSWSLRHLNSIKPWLLVHTPTTTTHAYDPRSGVWIEYRQPPLNYVSALRSSHSTLLYMISSSKLVFSNDPLHLTWHEADSPVYSRPDPVVAQVGHRVIILRGACEFYDDFVGVEIYDSKTLTWDTCGYMPEIFIKSASSTWLSVAVDERKHKMYVTEKSCGITYSFDPSKRTWCGPYDLRPDKEVFTCVVGSVHDRLIIAGLVGEAEDVKSVKMWEARGEKLKCEEVGQMPTELVEKLRGESYSVPSISMTCMANFVYVYNPSDAREVIVCEVVQGVCRWGSMRNVVVDEGNRMQSLLLTCSNVGLGDLERAMRSGDRSFIVKDM